MTKLCVVCGKEILDTGRNGKTLVCAWPKVEGKTRSECQHIKDLIYQRKYRRGNSRMYMKPKGLLFEKIVLDKDSGDVIKRLCLCCERMFPSQSKFNRICPMCSGFNHEIVRTEHKITYGGRRSI